MHDEKYVKIIRIANQEKKQFKVKSRNQTQVDFMKCSATRVNVKFYKGLNQAVHYAQGSCFALIRARQYAQTRQDNRGSTNIPQKMGMLKE